MHKIRLVGKVEGGRLQVDFNRLSRLIERFNGKEIELTISENIGFRRIEQNKYYWGIVLKAIADHSGNTGETIHKYFKDKFNQGETTTKLNVKEFTEYINNITLWALEQGIEIPTIDEVTE